jgi:two-component system, chemotaxis family, protein-glutamate methylesterase/glutaminase
MSDAAASPPPSGPAASGVISVMVVDDSAIIRGLITRTLETDPGIKVITSAANGETAISFLKRYPVDVIVLDIEMPVMDGIAAIPKLLEEKPDVKIIMASTLTLRNAEISMKAIELGAVDYIPKPTTNKDIITGTDFNHELLSKVKAWGLKAAAGRPASAPVSVTSAAPVARPTKTPKEIVLRKGPVGVPGAIAIASSTGGPQALFKVMPALKEVTQPVFITQHMPPSFTTILADHLKNLGGLPCVEAQDKMPVKGGQAYLAPGNYHMTIADENGGKVIKLNQNPPENFCRPAADPMLRSLVEVYGSRLFVAVLTGMGTDGFKGCQVVVEKGGAVISQDEATSVVWGMPAAVAEGGLCHAVLPIDQVGSYISNIAKRGSG